MLTEIEQRQSNVEADHQLLRAELGKLEVICSVHMVGSANSRTYKNCFNQVKIECGLLVAKAKKLIPEQNPYEVLYNIAYAEWLSHNDRQGHWSKVMRAISVIKAEALSFALV